MTYRHVAYLALMAITVAGCTTAPAPNDSASRALNEMKAAARPIPPKPDPRDGRIADLEGSLADRENEMARLRSQLSTLENQLKQKDQELSSLQSVSGERDRLASRVSDLEQQLSTKDRELGGLRGQVADSDRAAEQLAALQNQLSTKDQELAALKASVGDRDRLSSELAQTKHRLTDLEGQLAIKDQETATLKNSIGDRDRLTSELAQGKQRLADLERQLAAKDQEVATLKGGAGDRDRLATELAAAKQRVADLESEIARRDQEMTGLKGALDQQKMSLAQAKDDLSKLLQAEVAKGNVTMKQLGDQLTLGLATTLLFDSGESTLKPGGMDVLKRIGGVLKQYPDRSIHVAGHTDNVPIKGALAKKFPTNQELSQARADSARHALIDGGMAPERIDAMGHSDSRPIATNSTSEGRQKNRRVEIVVKH